MEAKIEPYPVPVSLFGTNTVMVRPHHVTKLLLQARFGGLAVHANPLVVFYTGVMDSPNTAVKQIRSWDDAWPLMGCFAGIFLLGDPY